MSLQSTAKELLAEVAFPGWFISPGNYFVSHLLFWRSDDPALSGYRLLAAFLISWFCWLRIIRLGYCIVGRIFGFYNPEHFRHFLTLQFVTLPLRAGYKLLLPLMWTWEEIFHVGKKPTARFSSPAETISLLFKPNYILLGRFRAFGIPLFQPIGTTGKSGKHLCLVAGTGGGKTVHLITMLSLHKGTAFVIDPKGQMAKVLLRRMGDGGNGIIGKHMKAGILDPSGVVNIHGYRSWKWNCWDEIDRARLRALAAGRDPDDAVVAFVQKIIDGLVVVSGKSDPFWAGAGKDFAVGLPIWMRNHLPAEQCNLSKFYELLTIGLPDEVQGSETGFDALVRRMSQDRSYGGIIASSAAGLQSSGGNTAASVLITLREQLKWVKRPGIQEISSGVSDFTLEELHSGKLVLFVCAKLSDIREDFPGWFRLLSSLTIAVFEDINKPLKNPCLVALDEFGHLGMLPAVQMSAGYMRSFGVRLLVILQNTKQLIEAGYENPETFIGNSECTSWRATNHVDNLAYLEQALGKRMIKEKLDGPPWWWRHFSKRPTRHGFRIGEVMTADQIKRFLDRGNVIITRGRRPLQVAPEPYYRALPVCFYDDADIPDKLPRRLTRAIFKLFISGRPTASTAEPVTIDAEVVHTAPIDPLPAEQAHTLPDLEPDALLEPAAPMNDPLPAAPKKRGRGRPRKSDAAQSTDIQF